MKNLKFIGITLFLATVFFLTPQDLIAKDEIKTVNINAIGTGLNQKDAIQVALRSAIEQTYGAFVSSKTELFNDNLVADEIVSISNGNIQSYKILNQSQLPDGTWGVTLNANISPNKLIEFAKSKGVEVEFQGSLFALNMKQQLLNDKAEFQAIKNLMEVLEKPLKNAFDYQLKSGEPKAFGSDYCVKLEVVAKANKNMDFCKSYLINNLAAISLSKNEVENYKKLNKRVLPLFISSEFNGENIKVKGFYFRNNDSFMLLLDFVRSQKTNYFKVETGNNTIRGDRMSKSMTSDESESGIERLINKNLSENNHSFAYIEYLPFGYKTQTIGVFNADKVIYPADFVNTGTPAKIIFPPIGKKVCSFIWNEKFTLEEIGKITGFKIEPLY